MIPISISILSAIIYVIFFSSFTLLTLRINPRIWLHDYPEEIQKIVQPKNEKEKNKTKILSIHFLIIFVGFPLGMTFLVTLQNNEIISFLDYLTHFLIILQLANLIDLLILDWLIFCKITPRFIVIPGSEGHSGYKNYKFHLIAFFKGIIISGVVSIMFALVSYLLGLFLMK